MIIKIVMKRTKKTTKKATVQKKETCMTDDCSQSKCSSGSCLYWLGFIGALVYFLQAATSFWIGVLGILKALLWPVILVKGLLMFLGA